MTPVEHGRLAVRLAVAGPTNREQGEAQRRRGSRHAVPTLRAWPALRTSPTPGCGRGTTSTSCGAELGEPRLRLRQPTVQQQQELRGTDRLERRRRGVPGQLDAERRQPRLARRNRRPKAEGLRGDRRWGIERADRRQAANTTGGRRLAPAEQQPEEGGLANPRAELLRRPAAKATSAHRAREGPAVEPDRAILKPRGNKGASAPGPARRTYIGALFPIRYLMS